ncbi:hypothetical protein RBI22_23375, partial [Alcaligenaceae bacterium C4P045]|nr:hypothetical protein [Alcaligenaceae bacterium C4P045]
TSVKVGHRQAFIPKTPLEQSSGVLPFGNRKAVVSEVHLCATHPRSCAWFSPMRHGAFNGRTVKRAPTPALEQLGLNGCLSKAHKSVPT